MTLTEMKVRLETTLQELKTMQERMEKIQADNHILAANLRDETKIVEGKIQMLDEMTPTKVIEPIMGDAPMPLVEGI